MSRLHPGVIGQLQYFIIYLPSLFPTLTFYGNSGLRQIKAACYQPCERGKRTSRIAMIAMVASNHFEIKVSFFQLFLLVS